MVGRPHCRASTIAWADGTGASRCCRVGRATTRRDPRQRITAPLARSSQRPTIPIVFTGSADPIGLGLCRQPGAAGWQHHGFTRFEGRSRANDWKCARDRAKSRARALAINREDGTPIYKFYWVRLRPASALGLRLYVACSMRTSDIEHALEALARVPTALGLPPDTIPSSTRDRIMGSRPGSLAPIYRIVSRRGRWPDVLRHRPRQLFRTAASFVDAFCAAPRPPIFRCRCRSSTNRDQP